MEISALLLLTLKGASEPASRHEIADFSKRDRLRPYFCQKNPRNTSILSIRAQKLFISLCGSGKRPDSWNSRHLKHFIVAVTATDMGDNHLERWSFPERVSLISF